MATLPNISESNPGIIISFIFDSIDRATSVPVPVEEGHIDLGKHFERQSIQL
jgi:hypothetical protein